MKTNNAAEVAAYDKLLNDLLRVSRSPEFDQDVLSGRGWPRFPVYESYNALLASLTAEQRTVLLDLLKVQYAKGVTTALNVLRDCEIKNRGGVTVPLIDAADPLADEFFQLYLDDSQEQGK